VNESCCISQSHSFVGFDGRTGNNAEDAEDAEALRPQRGVFFMKAGLVEDAFDVNKQQFSASSAPPRPLRYLQDTIQ
jgi:hypothetical protein